MTAHTYLRGHKIYYINPTGWFYNDTDKPIDDKRPCIRCGKYPTKEGHDACLGILDGVKFACCGHGVEKEYRIFR